MERLDKWVILDQLELQEHQGHLDLKVLLAPLDNRALLEHQDLQVPQAIQGSLEHLETVVLLVHLDLMEHLELQVLQVLRVH
jgi:hypothetical protein